MKYLELMRPKHYIKNFLIFLPLIFSKNLGNVNLLLKVILAFLAFNFAASFVYIINDIKDVEKDKLHEKKKNRPIASGRISIKKATLFSIIILLCSFLFNYLALKKLDLSYLYIILYIVINILYSFGLKNIPLVDIVILVTGFVIRVFYGANIINVDVSNWLYLTIISGSFYLGLGKRRNEIKRVGKDSREVLKYYTQSFLDKNMYMCLAISIVFYSLWTVDMNVLGKNNLLIWTVPLVILILMRYSMNIENDSLGDPVDVILEDKILIGLVLIYVLFTMAILYFV